jgi:hypothetical protein
MQNLTWHTLYGLYPSLYNFKLSTLSPDIAYILIEKSNVIV